MELGRVGERGGFLAFSAPATAYHNPSRIIFGFSDAEKSVYKFYTLSFNQ